MSFRFMEQIQWTVGIKTSIQDKRIELSQSISQGECDF